MGAAQALRLVLTFVSTIIVARIVAPDDYGVMAMVAPVIAFVMLFQNLGLSHAAIQARTLTEQQSNALFWLNVSASAAITVVLLAISPLVSWFYEDPRPGYVTAASALTMLISGMIVQHTALLNRHLRFRRLGAIDMASAVATFVITITAAVWLRNYWALWLGIFAGTITTAVLAWRSSGWRPSWRISFAGSGNLIRFGGAVTGFNLINFFHRNLDNILIGKVWGPTSLGLYDRSYRLMMFPLQSINGPIGRVMLPVLSRLQDDPVRFRRSYLLAVRSIMLAAGPPIAVACATSDKLIPFLLGEPWRDAAPIFFWLSLAAFLQPIGNSTGWVFMASGRATAMMRWGAFYTAFIVIAFSLGVRSGAAGLAAAYFLTIAGLMPFLFAYCARGTPLEVADFYKVSLPPIASAAAAYGSITWLMPDWSMIPLLAIALPIAYGWALLLTWILPEDREAARTILSLATRPARTRYANFLHGRRRA